MNATPFDWMPPSAVAIVYDSIRGLNDLLDVYGQAITDYERAQFALMAALGLPAYALFDNNAACAPGQSP